MNRETVYSLSRENEEIYLAPDECQNNKATSLLSFLEIPTLGDGKGVERTADSAKSPRRFVRDLFWCYSFCAGPLTYVIFFGTIVLTFFLFTHHLILPPSCGEYVYSRPNRTSPTHDALTPPRQKAVVVCEGGEVLTLVVYYANAFVFGELTELMRLPGLLGMLMSGLLLRCVSEFSTDYEIYHKKSELPVTLMPLNATHPLNLTGPMLIFCATLRADELISGRLRQLALATILTRAGIGLDPKVLRQVYTSVLRMASIPCMTEAMVAMVSARLLIGWPWSWAAMFGFILAAVSPAVVVPNMMRLEVSGWGTNHGIPTLAMAASSIDDVIAITGFGVAASFAFSTDNSLIQTLLIGPLKVLVGAVCGFMFGIVLWIIPPPVMEHSHILRSIMMVCFSIIAILGTVTMGLPGAGAVACLVFSITVSLGWQHGMPWIFRRPDPLLYPVHHSSKIFACISGQQQPHNRISLEHHDYYKQHLQHMLHITLLDSKNALRNILKLRRFSLAVPRSIYETHDFSSVKSSTSMRNQENLQMQPSLMSVSDYNESVCQQVPSVLFNSQNPNDKTNKLLSMDRGLHCLKMMRTFFATCWWFIQPFLFSLIGADINIEKMKPQCVGYGLLAMAIALSARMFAVVLAVTPSKLSFRERIFVAISWIPKASVQAAIGPVAIDYARKREDAQMIAWGEELLSLAALSILLTAPLGAYLMMITAPHLLTQDPRLHTLDNDVQITGSNI